MQQNGDEVIDKVIDEVMFYDHGQCTLNKCELPIKSKTSYQRDFKLSLAYLKILLLFFIS